MKRADEGLSKSINVYLNHYIAVTDAKAGAIAAVSLVVVGFVVAPESLSRDGWLNWLGAASAAIATLTAGSALYPRTPHSGNGHIFWGDIASHETALAYWKSLSSLDADGVGFEYARQNYDVSKVLIAKMKAVRWSIWLLAIGCAFIAIAYGTN